MPPLERNGMIVEPVRNGVRLTLGRRGSLLLSLEDARWLLTTALPAALVASEGREQVPDAIRQGYRGVREG